jgi:hypothetical protein
LPPIVTAAVDFCRNRCHSAGQAKANSSKAQGASMFGAELGLMIVYRLLALFVAGMMAAVVWRERDWRPQLFAALVFVPFILRAAGVK